MSNHHRTTTSACRTGGNPLRRLGALAAVVAAAASTSLVASPAVADEPVRDDRLTSTERRIVRDATKQYRDVSIAEADGYVPDGGCVAVEGLGGMGVHYVRYDLSEDAIVDPTAPEILVYAPHPDGSMRLVAVEYWVADADGDLATDGDRPFLFDRLPFDGPMPGHGPNMPVHYDLHVWLYDHNPAGQLAPFNPKVSCDG